MSDPQKLLAAYLDNALSDTERDELVAWLNARPDHLRAFAEANLFEQQIRQAVHGQVEREAAMHLVESGDSPQPRPHRISEAIRRPWFYRLWLRLVTVGAGARAMALAACLVVLAVGFAIWLKRPAAQEATSTAVAMLARAVDARWDPGTEPLRVGSALKPGWLRLKSGMAQVVFYSGARVVIEGPAELRLFSPNEAACPTGRLLAEVPQPARGFRVVGQHVEGVGSGHRPRAAHAARPLSFCLWRGGDAGQQAGGFRVLG